MPLIVTQICRYPVKGLSAEPLAQIELRPFQALPGDRRFAIAPSTTWFNPNAPEWLPKTSFLLLVTSERLARLKTRYNQETGILEIERQGRVVAKGSLLTQTGRSVIEDFLAAFLKAETRGTPKLLDGGSFSFLNTQRPLLTCVNLASVRDLERVSRAPVDPLRFRANLYLDGGEAWEELRWIGGELRIGQARLRAIGGIEVSAAANVNPATGERDLNIPALVEDGFRRNEMGLYVEVIEGGDIALGDRLIPAPVGDARLAARP